MQSTRRLNAVLLALALMLVVFNPFASVAERFNRETFASATAIYTSYRVINRVLAVAADTSVQVGVVGASAGFKPGQILRSLLDTLDRFADLLFPLMVLAGVMSIAVVPVAMIGALLALAGVALRILADLPRLGGLAFVPVLARLGNAAAGLGFLVALIIPASYTLGYLLGERLTARSWHAAVATFEAFATSVESTDDALRLATTEALPPPEDTAAQGPAAPAEPVPEAGGVQGWVDWAGQRLSGGISGVGDAWDTFSGGIGTLASGARNLGSSSVQAVGSIPDYLEKSTNLVAAAFQYLVALIVKTLVIPMVLVGIGLWLWRVLTAPVSARLMAR